MTRQVYVDGNWTGDRLCYYRYTVGGEAAHRVKYALEPDHYEQLAADPGVSDPAEASEQQVAQYAAVSLAYDSQGQIIRRQVAGAESTQLQYLLSDYEGTSYNAWKHQLVRMPADGSVETVYRNVQGQPLLSEFREMPARPRACWSGGSTTVMATSRCTPRPRRWRITRSAHPRI